MKIEMNTDTYIELLLIDNKIKNRLINEQNTFLKSRKIDDKQKAKIDSELEKGLCKGLRIASDIINDRLSKVVL